MASLKNTRSMPAPRILSLYCSKYILSLSSRPSKDGILKIEIKKRAKLMTEKYKDSTSKKNYDNLSNNMKGRLKQYKVRKHS